MQSAVTHKIVHYAVTIVDVILLLPRIEGPNSIKGPHDKYVARFRDLLDSLYIDLASLVRHYTHHRQLEEAASMFEIMAELLVIYKSDHAV